MNYRTTTLLARTDIGPSGTKVIPIRVDQPISRIMLEWQVLKATVGMNSYCHKDISKIELVDGSDVLFSLDGGQCQALNIYDRKCKSMNDGVEIAANVQLSYYGLDFGRYLWDPMLALDPNRFKNLQLKVTYSEIISDILGSAGSLEVIAEVFDEKIISPMGFLMSKEHHHYTVGADDSYEYIELPTDFPYRKILIQGYDIGEHPYEVLSEARLNEDNEKRIPWNWDLERYHIHRKGIDQPVQEEISGQLTGTSNVIYATPTNYWATIVVMAEAKGRTLGNSGTGKGGKFTIISDTTGAWTGIVKGYLPNHCFQFPFGNEQDIDDWYEVSKIGHLELRLRAGPIGAGGGSGAVVLQQLRRY